MKGRATLAVSIKDIATKANVSVATVSRALNGQGYVREELKNRIIAVAEEMHYSPKKYKGRTTTRVKNSLIGIIVPDISNSYFSGIIQGVEEVAESKHHDVIICDSQENPNKEVTSIATMHNCKVRGIIITPVSDAVEYNAHYLKELNDSGIPIVLVDRDLRMPGIDSVTIDNFQAAYNAVTALIEKGHTNIAILAGPTTSRTGVDRLNGYMSALKEHDISVQEDMVFFGDFKFDSGYKMTKKLLDHHNRPTAIFSCNQRMTLGCIRALAEKDMKIPDDIALISFGISEARNQAGLQISHVFQPGNPLGVESAKCLFSRIEMGRKYKKVPCKKIQFSAECNLLGSEEYPINRA